MLKYWNKIKYWLEKLIKEINRLCKNYQPTIQSIGIIVGLYIIYLTYQSVKISNYQLQLALKQESQKELPIWDFQVNDSMSTAKMQPFSQDVKLEIATAYFSEKLFYKDSGEWNIDSPEFTLHLTVLKSYLERIVIANSTYRDSIVSIAVRNNIPLGIEMSYIQYGELRTARAIFLIQYTWVRDDEYSADIIIDGIRFSRYLYSNENLQEELGKIIDQKYKGMKRPESN